ncbi:MAG: GNAT family N-acetyltransferase [Promethearchaeota archaeon]
MSYIIRECTEKDIKILTRLLRQSFHDVAKRYNLTIQNAPSHPSNCTEEWIIKSFENGIKYFILEQQNIPYGCVALEQANSEVCYLERLGVLIDHRHKGYGKALVNYIIQEAKKRNAKRVEIGIIAENVQLKKWYERQGFIERNTVKFEHLPFNVLFMYKEL